MHTPGDLHIERVLVSGCKVVLSERAPNFRLASRNRDSYSRQHIVHQDIVYMPFANDVPDKRALVATGERAHEGGGTSEHVLSLLTRPDLFSFLRSFRALRKPLSPDLFSELLDVCCQLAELAFCVQAAVIGML